MPDAITPTLTIEFDEQSWGPDDVAGRLITADGEVLYQHVSSSKWWLEADLTRNFGRAAALADRYPDGFTIAWKDVR